MSFIAPQAYTKETLAKAFDWLQHQPDHVKQMATTPDTLVGIYLKAQRQSANKAEADAPVSSKRFIDDLKTLKKDIAMFDDSTVQEAPQREIMYNPQREPRSDPPRDPPREPQRETQREPQRETPRESHRIIESTVMAQQQQHIQQIQQHQPLQPNPVTISPQVSFPMQASLPSSLDEASLNAVYTVQQRFNLSSPHEALRMLITVGLQHISRWH